MTSLRILLSLAIVHLGVFATGCAPDRQKPEQRGRTVEQAQPSAQEEGVISDQDFETGGMGQWEDTSAAPEDSSEDGEKEKPPTP